METIEELIEEYVYYFNEYLEDELDYPDEAENNYSAFLFKEMQILKYFGLPNRKPYKIILSKIIDESVYEKKIAPKRHLPRINYSKKISTQIITTMKKLEQIKPYVSKMNGLFKNLFKEYEKSEPVTRENLPTYSGIYVFYNYGQPIYVGRANNIRTRIQYHTRKNSGSESATFAFNLAKMEFIKQDTTTKKRRKELMATSEFLEIFNKQKLNLSNCQIKCLKIENDILQTMFEPYLAFKLGTYPINNTFENH